MTPADYTTGIVLPTVAEFLADRGDRRRAYLACIVVGQLVDWIARAEGGETSRAKKVVTESVGAVCGSALERVRGIANGTKHAGPGRGYRFVPGSERDVPVAVWDVTYWDAARWDVPGLQVEHDGAEVFVDHLVMPALKAFVECYPQHLGGVDLGPLGALFRTSLG